jgi:hypothetical protein
VQADEQAMKSDASLLYKKPMVLLQNVNLLLLIKVK